MWIVGTFEEISHKSFWNVSCLYHVWWLRNVKMLLFRFFKLTNVSTWKQRISILFSIKSTNLYIRGVHPAAWFLYQLLASQKVSLSKNDAFVTFIAVVVMKFVDHLWSISCFSFSHTEIYFWCFNLSILNPSN